MIKIYECLFEDAVGCVEDSQKFQFLRSLLRSIIQASAVSALEVYVDATSSDEGVDINALIKKLHHPSDGDPAFVLDELIPRIRSTIWPTFATGWFEISNSGGMEKRQALSGWLQKWVAFRNDRPGHGVMDKKLTTEWAENMAELVRQSLHVLSDSLPKVSSNGQAFVETPVSKCQIITPLVHNDEPLVVRRFVNKRGVWSIEAQTVNWEESVPVRLDVPNGAPTVMFLPDSSGKFYDKQIAVDGKVKTILSNLPARQASVFEGRHGEQEELVEWITDYESRACLVYGDGGVGKTTLVLEVLNNLADDEVDFVSGSPEVISYYSAKVTRWTASGIIHFKSVSTAVEDSVRELVLVFDDVLTKGWYKTQGRALVDRVASVLRDAGLERDDVLLVLDNTETMARKLGEEEDLSKLITQISRKVARVLMTSRRREKVEAKQVELLPMNEVDALRLLRRLGEEYHADAIVQAGDSRLRRIARNLGGKPLLIDVMARHVGATKGSLDDAYATVMQESNEGLSEFLYEDAWMRMAESHRRVFLALTCLSVPLNSRTVGWVCREMDVPHTEWLNSFYETYFGKIVEYGSEYQMELENFACDFFRLKVDALSPFDKKEVLDAAHKVDSLAVRADKAKSEYTRDRVDEAFRTPSARAAKVAGAKGELKEAVEWYQEAVKEDPHNSFLYDRYAWFMMVKVGDLDSSLRFVERAIEINARNADAHLTKALLLYRKGDILEGDKYINLAVGFGKPEGLGLLRKGIARFYEAVYGNVGSNKKKLLRECSAFLRNSIRKLDDSDPYFMKNLKDAERFLRKAAIEERKLDKVG